MRVLHVNSTAAKAGGAEIFLYDLMDWQRRRGLTVGLFAKTSGEARDEAEIRLVKRPDWDPDHLISDEGLVRDLTRFLESFRPELIHLHNLHALPVGIIQTLAAAGVPLVQHVHDASAFCANAWLTWPDGQLCTGGVGRKCQEHGCEKNYPYDGRILASVSARTEALRSSVDAWITSSEAFRALCERHGFSPVTRIPYWSPPPPPRSVEVARRPLVLSVGRLVPEKGVGVLVKAWPAIRSARPDAELVIAGDGPERAPLEKLASDMGMDPRSVFRGRIPHDEVDALMRSASVLVVPSIWFEAFGLTILEAQRAGLPPVVSQIGGMAELVEHERSGLLVPTRDSVSLAAAVIRLLTDEALHQRCVKGGLEAAKAREPDTPMQQILEVYAQARARGQSHRRAIDLDALHGIDVLLKDLQRVERWALDMKKHIEYLEGIGRADQPVKSFARHMKFWLKSKRPGR